MTPVMQANYNPADDRYPIVVVGPDWWEKMSTDEALALAEELRMAVAQHRINEWLEAA